MADLNQQLPLLAALVALVTPILVFITKLYDRMVDKAETREAEAKAREAEAVARADKNSLQIARLSEQQADLLRLLQEVAGWARERRGGQS